MMPLFSILDQLNYSWGMTHAQAVNNSFTLANVAEELGYHRYWLAEHHNIPGLACTAPEIMISQIASRTSRLRVGSGGVLVRHHAPLRIAENFKLLETLFPGRIDLGVGRGVGTDKQTLLALHDGSVRDSNRYLDQLYELNGFLKDSFPEDHHYKSVHAFPNTTSIPELWILGTSESGALAAAQIGAAFSYAHFFNADNGPRSVQIYRDKFQPSLNLDRPKVMVGVFVICAETESEAAEIASSYEVGMMLTMTGRPPIPELPIAAALNFNCTIREQEIIDGIRRTMIVGTQESVGLKLRQLNDEFNEVDEFIVLTICYDFQTRLNSYRLLSNAFELPD